MNMTKEILDKNDKIVTVWFDAWRYEREEHLAVIPFLRTVKLSLDATHKSKSENWENVKKGVVNAANVFTAITKITPAPGITFDLEKATEALKEDSPVVGDDKVIYYHVTDFLEKALKRLREEDARYRIVIFVDDLDRCSPGKALEVLESIKSFFDLEGFVYVIGMDSKTINSLVRKKYGEESTVEGLDYLQKIVQLPFQIPTGRETDISASISKIISKGLEGSPDLIKEFEKHKTLIVKAVQLNPREVKRFINNIILARAVYTTS
jgi:predicted KAP-like P-loop ATPase